MYFSTQVGLRNFILIEWVDVSKHDGWGGLLYLRQSIGALVTSVRVPGILLK